MEGLTNYEKEERPWGNFERFTNNEKATVKIITINAGESISLQIHEHRDEFWRVLKGSGVVHIADRDTDANEGDDFFVPRHTEHRISSGSGGFSFLEISFGEFEESDEKRIDDQYGRV